jgi:hypothetical protein
MPNSTDVSVEPKTISVIPGETRQTTATVKNSGDTISQFTFRLEGLEPDWYHLPVASTTLFPNDEERLSLAFHPPGTAEPGLYPCHLIIERPESPEDIPLNLEVRKIPEFKLEITPEQITGKRGLYRIIAHNEGENAVTLQLQATDHDAILRCNLLPAQLSVPGSGTAESTMEVKLGWARFFRRQRQYRFTVAARQTGADRVKTVSGQLVTREIRLPVKLPPLLPRRRPRQPPDITRFEAVTADNRSYTLVWVAAQAREVRLDGVNVGLQGDLPVSPGAATSYTLTAASQHGMVSRTVTIEPPPVPEARFSDRILVIMVPDVLRVAAGAEPTEATLEIQNTGSIVDKFSLEIEGLAGAWYSASAPWVALMPHAKEQVQISFHPPKVSGVKSGSYPFAVTLRSQSLPQDSASVTARLEVLPSVDYGLTVRPYRLLCRRNGAFQIQISNRDVSDAVVFLDMTDIENGLRFQVGNDSPVVPPWQNIEVPMVVRPRRNSIIGDLKRYDISVTASTAEGLTQVARCQVDHKPLLSSWRPILRSLKYIIFIGIAGCVVYYVIRLGGGWGSLVRDPQTWLDGTLRHVRGWFY